jgi:predicted O-linked N-acetylglucosamine transferase (SPINDLY family)
VPNAQFVFITIRPESEASEIFKARLVRAFKEKNLDPNFFLFFTHGINPDEFSTLASLCDLGLDTIGWSGCNSSLETLAAGTPILTSPSVFMRSRHTSGILTMMGCDELIASTPKNLVEKAVAIALDESSLKRLTTLTSNAISKVYRDLESIRGLERAIREWTTMKPQS